MSETCSNNCSSCQKKCSDRKEKNPFLAEENAHSHVKKVIGIVSGKGGVGKSLVTSLLASERNHEGKKVAILDADITGPSIPKAFGVDGEVKGSEEGIYPLLSRQGIKMMSLNFLVEDESQPVIWRGPILANTVKQFWSDVIWEEVDEMYVDMPPGTSDIPLTIFQSIPLAGIIVVTTPQDLVSMIVAKAVHMAEKMNIPILGMVENMSYFTCPKCGEKLAVFGESKAEAVAKEYGIDTIARIPIKSELSKACDEGTIEEIQGDFIQAIGKKIEAL